MTLILTNATVSDLSRQLSDKYDYSSYDVGRMGGEREAGSGEREAGSGKRTAMHKRIGSKSVRNVVDSSLVQ